jgi:hypothetical protein
MQKKQLPVHFVRAAAAAVVREAVASAWPSSRPLPFPAGDVGDCSAWEEDEDCTGMAPPVLDLGSLPCKAAMAADLRGVSGVLAKGGGGASMGAAGGGGGRVGIVAAGMPVFLATTCLVGGATGIGAKGWYGRLHCCCCCCCCC